MWKIFVLLLLTACGGCVTIGVSVRDGDNTYQVSIQGVK
jgi:hypothetical protein